MQNAAHPGFTAADQPYDCGQCIAYHETQYDFPALTGLNLNAWELYAQLQDQQRSGGMDVIGLDYAVLPVVFDVYDIPHGAPRRQLFERLVTINRVVGEHRARQREIEAETAKAKAASRPGGRRR